MGQGKSTLNNTPLYDAKEFEVLAKKNDTRYGSIQPLIHRTSGQSLAVITKTLQEESEVQQRVAELDVREKLIHPNLIQLIRKNARKQEDFCSTFYEIGLLYEYLEGNLKIEISERRSLGIAFSEGELWYLLESLLSVVNYLKSQQLTHSDIRPYNVMLTEEGIIKLGEVFQHNKPISGFSQLLNQQIDEHYISPQQFHRLRNFKDASDTNFDKNKSEIYSVGMTVLEAATLNDTSNLCYDKETHTIRTDTLNQLLDIVQNSYSEQLHNILENMLVESEADRADVEPLLNEIQQSYIQLQKATNITPSVYLQRGLELQKEQQLQYVESPQQQEELEFHQEEEKVVVRQQPVVAAVVQQPAVIVEDITYNQTDNNDELNARIQAVLAMSRDTIARYGVTNYQPEQAQSFQPSTQYQQQSLYTSHSPLVDAKASQIETRTFLNQNTNTIQTTTYSESKVPLKTTTIEEKPLTLDKLFVSNNQYTYDTQILSTPAVDTSVQRYESAFNAPSSTYTTTSYTTPVTVAAPYTSIYTVPAETTTTYTRASNYLEKTKASAPIKTSTYVGLPEAASSTVTGYLPYESKQSTYVLPAVTNYTVTPIETKQSSYMIPSSSIYTSSGPGITRQSVCNAPVGTTITTYQLPSNGQAYNTYTSSSSNVPANALASSSVLETNAAVKATSYQNGLLSSSIVGYSQPVTTTIGSYANYTPAASVQNYTSTFSQSYMPSSSSTTTTTTNAATAVNAVESDDYVQKLLANYKLTPGDNTNKAVSSSSTTSYITGITY